MIRFLLSGLFVISTTTASSAIAGGPGLLRHHCLHGCLSHHCAHKACHCSDCSQQPIVIHCCPGDGPSREGGMERSRRENAETQQMPSTIIQSTIPSFGYGGFPQYAMPQMAFMPYPVAAQANYQTPESQRQRTDCCEQLDRLEEDVRQLAKDVDRIVDIVDRHSLILDRLTEVLAKDPNIGSKLVPPKAQPPAPQPADDASTSDPGRK
jgi:hypothetical protein